MWVSILLYIVAGALLVYIIWSIFRTRKVTVDQALALLGTIVAVIIALNTAQLPETDTPTAADTAPATTRLPLASTLKLQAATMTPSRTPIDLAPATVTPSPPSPVPIKEYGMPRSGGRFLVFDTALRVVFGDRLVKLDIIEDEDRFKASTESILWQGDSIAWDRERRHYWTVGCSGSTCGVRRMDAWGEEIATYSLPEDVLRLEWVAWDGDYLLGSEGQTIYKLEPPQAGGMMQLVDSYAPTVHRFPDQSITGLTWDGEHLWVLSKDALARLDKAGRPECALQVSGGPNWWGYEGLAWDGSWLWVAYPEANTVYRIDPAACRETRN